MKKNISIFTHAKKVLFATYGRIVALLLLNAVVIFLLFVPLALAWGSVAFVQELLGMGAGLSDSPGTFWVVLFGIGTTIVAMFVTFITSAATASVLIRNKSLSGSIKFGVTKGLKSIPVQVLFLVLLFVSSMPSLFLILFASGITNYALALLFLLLGMFLFLLPFLIGLRSIFAVFIWLENQKARAWPIVKTSFALTRGSVVWMMILAIVVVGVGASIIHSPIVLLLSALTTLPPEGALATIADQIISIFLLMPVVYALFYALYVYAKKQSAGVKRKSV